MSEEPNPGASVHKLTLGAALIMALGGMARLSDDCGRATVHSGLADDLVRGGKGLGDDVARGASPGGDLLRPGGALADEVARRSPPSLGAAAVPGEGSLARVVDDAAPGRGVSLEEALREAGVDVAFEVITMELSGGGDDPRGEVEGDAPEDEPAEAPTAAPPRVLAAATWAGAKDDFEASAADDVLAIVIAKDAAGAFTFGDERLDEPTLHARCHELRVRCVILACEEGAPPTCPSLASGMGRMAADTVPAAGSPMQRSLVLASELIRQRAKLGASARSISLSRLDVGGKRLVRSHLRGPAPGESKRAE